MLALATYFEIIASVAFTTELIKSGLFPVIRKPSNTTRRGSLLSQS
jgi:hypothetical protein